MKKQRKKKKKEKQIVLNVSINATLISFGPPKFFVHKCFYICTLNWIFVADLYFTMTVKVYQILFYLL